MGERIFRPGIRTSDKTAALIRDREGGWFAQVVYDWLITVVDDYGRYDARPMILKAELFPLLLDLVREADIQRSLLSMQRAGLIRLYGDAHKPLLEMTNWRQRLRAARSKWPSPDGKCHDIGVTMPTDTETDTETEYPLNPPVGEIPKSSGRAERQTAKQRKKAEALRLIQEAANGSR